VNGDVLSLFPCPPPRIVGTPLPLCTGLGYWHGSSSASAARELPSTSFFLILLSSGLSGQGESTLWGSLRWDHDFPLHIINISTTPSVSFLSPWDIFSITLDFLCPCQTAASPFPPLGWLMSPNFVNLFGTFYRKLFPQGG